MLGNEQADRIAKRSLNLVEITHIDTPRKEYMKKVRKKIIKEWQREYDLTNTYKIRGKLKLGKHATTVIGQGRLYWLV